MYTTLLILSAICAIGVPVFGTLAAFLKNNTKTYKILVLVCTVFGIVFGTITKIIDKDVEENEKHVKKAAENPSTIYNINGDFVNRDKNINEKSEEKIEKKTESVKQDISSSQTKNNPQSSDGESTKKEEPKKENIINNGIINSGVNNGTQTVNNYNEIPLVDRHLSAEDIDFIKKKIPLKYNIQFHYESSEETVSYTKELFESLKRMGYKIIAADGMGKIFDANIKRARGNKFHIMLVDNEPRAIITVLDDY